MTKGIWRAFKLSQIGKQCIAGPLYSFYANCLSAILRKLLVGEISPLPIERHLRCRLHDQNARFISLSLGKEWRQVCPYGIIEEIISEDVEP